MKFRERLYRFWMGRNGSDTLYRVTVWVILILAVENRAFLRFFGKIRGWFVLQKNRFRDRKTHIYRKCPGCRRTLRLPKIKGDHTVCCPCCGKKFQVKV